MNGCRKIMGSKMSSAISFTNAATVTHENAVTKLTLNRPDKLNALNADMIESMITGIVEAKARESQLLVLQGAGRNFSSGFDLSDLDQETDANLLYRFVRIEALLQAIITAPMPTLALVQGSCFGAGADIVASCTHRVATENSRFRLPGLQFGIVLGTRRLAALIGSTAAYDILQTSRVFDGNHALSCGFLTEILDVACWPMALATIAKHSAVLPAESCNALLKHIHDDSRLDNDMAELVRSASHPGLANRMKAYLKSLKKI